MATQIVLPGNLTGNQFVRSTRPALSDARFLLPRMRDRARLRRHALKLRFWPENHPTDDAGQVLDLNWSWIKSLKNGKPSHRIGELRISERIGNCDNLRIIFYAPQAESLTDAPDPMLWVLAAIQKKSNAFTKANIATFKARKRLIDERYYFL